jgi:hypothetical protein
MYFKLWPFCPVEIIHEVRSRRGGEVKSWRPYVDIKPGHQNTSLIIQEIYET